MGFVTVKNFGAKGESSDFSKKSAATVELESWQASDPSSVQTFISDKDPLSEFWLSELAKLQKSKAPVFISLGPCGEIVDITRTRRDVIRSVEIRSNGDLKVNLAMSEVSRTLTQYTRSEYSLLSEWASSGQTIRLSESYPDFRLLQIAISDESDPVITCRPYDWGECRVLCNTDGNFTPVENPYTLFDEVLCYFCSPTIQCQQQPEKCIPIAENAGCYARAHEICRRLCLLMGIQARKIFVGPSKIGEAIVDSHVAPVICDETGQKFVLDPAVDSSKPLLVDEWLNKIEFSGTPKEEPASKYANEDFDYPCCHAWETLVNIRCAKEKYKAMHTRLVSRVF